MIIDVFKTSLWNLCKENLLTFRAKTGKIKNIYIIVTVLMQERICKVFGKVKEPERENERALNVA